jgi:hypothetical protein
MGQKSEKVKMGYGNLGKERVKKKKKKKKR